MRQKKNSHQPESTQLLDCSQPSLYVYMTAKSQTLPQPPLWSQRLASRSRSLDLSPKAKSCALSSHRVLLNCFNNTISAWTLIVKGVKPTFDGPHAVTLSPALSLVIVPHCFLRRSCGKKGTQIVLNGWPGRFCLPPLWIKRPSWRLLFPQRCHLRTRQGWSCPRRCRWS